MDGLVCMGAFAEGRVHVKVCWGFGLLFVLFGLELFLFICDALTSDILRLRNGRFLRQVGRVLLGISFLGASGPNRRHATLMLEKLDIFRLVFIDMSGDGHVINEYLRVLLLLNRRFLYLILKVDNSLLFCVCLRSL